MSQRILWYISVPLNMLNGRRTLGVLKGTCYSIPHHCKYQYTDSISLNSPTSVLALSTKVASSFTCAALSPWVPSEFSFIAHHSSARHSTQLFVPGPVFAWSIQPDWSSVTTRSSQDPFEERSLARRGCQPLPPLGHPIRRYWCRRFHPTPETTADPSKPLEISTKPLTIPHGRRLSIIPAHRPKETTFLGRIVSSREEPSQAKPNLGCANKSAAMTNVPTRSS